MKILALDLGKFNSALCFYDSNTRKAKFLTSPTRRERLDAVFVGERQTHQKPIKRKTDKDDALKLARLAAMGELKGVHVPSAEHREFRSLVK